MKRQPTIWQAVTISLVLVTILGCASLSPVQKSLLPTATSTPTSQVILKSGGVVNGQGGSGTGSGQGGSGAGNGQGGNGGSNNDASTPVPTPNPIPPVGAPYVVKQIITLGNETISGQVCSVTGNFLVTSTTPAVTFQMLFFPQGAERGSLSYAYSIPKAGETHAATGSYTITSGGADGTLLVTMAVRDHVVFKGFDGIIPINYKYDLVPSQATSCPARQ